MDLSRLRPGLALARTPTNLLVIHDPMRIGTPVVVSPRELEIAQGLTGRPLSSLTAIASEETILSLVRRLQVAGLLDDAVFHARRSPDVRPFVCFDPDRVAPLRTQIEDLFLAPGGAGMPKFQSSRSPRAVLVPHMDYPRGNITYGHGFHHLLTHSNADTLVILATSHYSAARFSLTKMHFDTPFGVVETDRDYVNRIADHIGPAAWSESDPLAHFPEHSIELEVVILKAMIDRPFRIVPILCGSFHDAIHSGMQPRNFPDIQRMVEALRAAEAGHGREVCYLVSGDLAHIGPKFDDPHPVDSSLLATSRRQDERLLNAIQTGDADDYFRVVAEERDARRICGVSPTIMALEVVKPTHGRVTHYQQFVHPQGFESVSFASAVWE